MCGTKCSSRTISTPGLGSSRQLAWPDFVQGGGLDPLAPEFLRQVVLRNQAGGNPLFVGRQRGVQLALIGREFGRGEPNRPHPGRGSGTPLQSRRRFRPTPASPGRGSARAATPQSRSMPTAPIACGHARNQSRTPQRPAPPPPYLPPSRTGRLSCQSLNAGDRITGTLEIRVFSRSGRADAPATAAPHGVPARRGRAPWAQPANQVAQARCRRFSCRARPAPRSAGRRGRARSRRRCAAPTAAPGGR